MNLLEDTAILLQLFDTQYLLWSSLYIINNQKSYFRWNQIFSTDMNYFISKVYLKEFYNL